MIGARIWPALLAAAAAQLCILEPSSLRSRLPGGCLWGATAAFASPGYADRIQGRLLWVPGHGCSTTQAGDPAVQSSAASAPPAGPIVGNWSAPEKLLGVEAAPDQIVVRRVGHCSFAQKARDAYRRGAQALVVVDSADSLASGDEVRQAAIGGDDGAPAGLVPTLFLGREAEQIVELASGGEAITVELRWDLRHQVVKLDVWLSAYDPSAAGLLQQLAPMARALGGSMTFRPHYHVQAVPAGTPRSAVAHDCFHSIPQFCTEGVDGIDGGTQLQEAMRQHCLRVVSGGAARGFSAAWWAYVEQLPFACPEGSSPSCRRSLLASSGADVAAVEQCVAERGLTFLEDDRESSAWWSPSQVVIRINDGRYSGPLAAVSVSRAICRRFEALPEACAAFGPSVEAPPSETEVPLWVLVGWCIATFLASSAALCLARWLGSRCRRVRQKRA